MILFFRPREVCAEVQSITVNEAHFSKKNKSDIGKLKLISLFRFMINLLNMLFKVTDAYVEHMQAVVYKQIMCLHRTGFLFYS